MDWPAINLSLQLGLWTVVLLIPTAVVMSRILAWRRCVGRNILQALLTPSTVMGFYLLISFGGQSSLDKTYASLMDEPLVFTFQGLLLTSLIFTYRLLSDQYNGHLSSCQLVSGKLSGVVAFLTGKPF